ncbi:MAG: TetR/AcrR family transcriptional regulator [Deltaproteobacteria bacterium]|nr:TetR/AcrR family transcriptional regulator [Deltaproteobacteria bacterium]
MGSSGGTGASFGGRPWVQKEVPTLVKDRDLVETRRLQIIQAAVGLFIEKGFHQTTIRQIAAQAGLSIGSLYEYVRSKEDILYLVCDHIHAEMERRLRASISQAADGREALVQAVKAYFAVCDALADDILLIYQETKSLAPEARSYVLDNDARLTGLFEEILNRGAADHSLSVDGPALGLTAHNITVLGHMWTFRRWYLAKNYSLEEYTRLQTQLLLSELGQDGKAKK